ncbi:MAG: hypothetical protein JRI40_09065, partial [Deltaproteobacteria bacterium]|nr:hypothetical protein [Deltaproteobacteria bacterium]
QNIPGAICPFPCCALGRRKNLGAYGEQFGLPEYDVEVKDGRITGLHVRRGASCGATWQVIPRMIEVPVDEALSTNWKRDPVSLQGRWIGLRPCVRQEPTALCR